MSKQTISAVQRMTILFELFLVLPLLVYVALTYNKKNEKHT